MAEVDNTLRDLHDSSYLTKPHPITVVLFIQNIFTALKTQKFIETGSHFGVHLSQNSGKFLRCCCILDVCVCKIYSVYITSGLPSKLFCIFAVIFISKVEIKAFVM